MSLSVAGDICELAVGCFTKFLLCGLNVQKKKNPLKLFEAPQEILLLFSYLSVSRFSIHFSKGIRLLLDIRASKNI